MKLIRLRLEHFRQHRDTTVEFRDGMTAIVGANGSGKSTILEAVTFALFGEQRHTKDSIKFHWAGPKDRFRVELTFEFGGRRYVVERGEKGAELRADGNVVAEGLREVKGACERLLRLTHDQFVNSFCAEQKSLEFLKFKDRTTRQSEVARMLGLDRLKEASDAAKVEARRCKDKATVLEEELGSREQFEAAQREAEARLAGHEARRAEAGKELAEAQARSVPVRKRGEEAARWLELQKQIQDLRNDGVATQTLRAAIGEEIEVLKKQAEEFAGLEDAERQFQEAKARLAEHEALAAQAFAHSEATRGARKRELEAEQIRELLAEAGVARPEEIEAQTASLGMDVNVLQQQHAEAEEAWRSGQRDATRAVAEAQAVRDQASQAVERSRRMTPGSACPECGQTIHEDYAHLAEQREKALAQAELALEQARRAVDALAAPPKALTALAEHLKDARNAAAAAQAHRDTLAKAFARLAEIEAEGGAHPAAPAPAYRPEAHEKAKALVQDLEPRHERFVALKGSKERHADALGRFAATQEKFQQLKASCEALQAEQGKGGFADAAEAEAARESQRDLEVLLGRLQGEASGLESLVEGTRREAEAARKRVAELDERAGRMRRLRVDQAHFETVAREMLSLRESLNQQIRPDLEARASDNLQALSGGRYTTLELDGHFEPTVLDDGVSKTVISGGEEDIVALCLRLALSELIQERQGTPLSLLVLDEVFGSLDGERRQHVMERLAGLKGRFEQILVISHIEEINQVADQCVYLFRDEGSKSTYASDAPVAEAPILLL